MAIAYLILAEKNADQIARIVKQLNTPNAVFFIHVDTRADIKSFQLALEGILPHRIRWVKRQRAQWGNISVVEAILNGLRMFLDDPQKLQQIVLLSEQCYPIISAKDIEVFLSRHQEKILMHYHPLQDNEKVRIEKYHFYGRVPDVFPPEEWLKSFKEKIFNRFLAMRFPLPRRFPSYIQPFSGSPLWGLPRQAVEYVFNFLQKHPDYFLFHRNTKFPEEMFFQTIFLNANEGFIQNNIVLNDLHYLNWFKPDVPLPAVLMVDDFQAIVDSKQLFARKFDPKQDSKIMDLIDDRIARRGF